MTPLSLLIALACGAAFIFGGGILLYQIRQSIERSSMRA